MSPSEPLAKSADQRPVPLAVHLREVAEYARSIVTAYRGHVDRLLGVELGMQVERAVVLAALTHDLGKAAVGFQQSLQDRRARWGFRHEVLSTAVLLAMLNLDDQAIRLALAAVLTHHRDVGDMQLRNDAGLIALPEPSLVQEAVNKFRRRAHEMQAYWQWLREFCATHDLLRSFPFPDTPALVPLPADFLEQLEGWAKTASPFENPEAMALLLTRGWMMAADHAASAGVLHVQRELPPPTLPSVRPFQERLGRHEGSALLEAPTGSGKTFAALLWALHNRRHGERIFYLLPYQASIEAMAETLANRLGKENVAVLHARALDYAFREYFEKSGEYEVAYGQARGETELNRFVHKPLKVATPFQLLKWLFGIPRFEIGVSEMLGGVFIFDEIHAYDAHVVGLIIEMVRVLNRLGGRCLFMSATFPSFMKELLQGALGGRAAEFTLRNGEEDAWTSQILSQVRHRVRWHDEPLEALTSQIVHAAQQGQRVLVVANRVAQAQGIYQGIRHELEGVSLLHSRFTRHDRTAKERRILAALQGKRNEPVRVLVATQVVEVSLDISFDTIFTEVAPVDDLLQRFGRVNRYGEHPDGVPVHIARQFESERLRWVYELGRLQQTLDHAPPDGTALTVDRAADWVRRVYQDGWSESELKRFDSVSSAFQAVIRSLRPLHYHAEGEEEFHGLFQSVEVLPKGLYAPYDEHLRNKHYLLATQLLVPISLATLHGLNKVGRLQRLKDGVLLADIRYDQELGLLPQEVDFDAAII